jgi:hypothetical protein
MLLKWLLGGLRGLLLTFDRLVEGQIVARHFFGVVLMLVCVDTLTTFRDQGFVLAPNPSTYFTRHGCIDIVSLTLNILWMLLP